MKRITRIAISVLLVFSAIMAFKYVKYIDNENKIKNQIEILQSNNIGEYFDAFIISNNFQKYHKTDFLNFIREYNSDIIEILGDKSIIVRDLNGLHSIYHVGNNQSDDDLNKDDISIYISTAASNIKKDFIYTVDRGKLIALSYFNVNKLIAKIIPCDNVKNVSYTLNPDYFPIYDTLYIKNDRFKFSNHVDSRIVNLLEKDSLINQYSKEYDFLFSIFAYEPIDSFYCDSLVSYQ